MNNKNLAEYKKRGSIDFPIEYHYLDSNHTKYEMPFHWHIECEMIRILSGSFHLILDGRDYLLESGDICFVQDGVLHGGTPKDCIYECLVFGLSMFRNRNYAPDRFIRSIDHHQIILSPLISPCSEVKLQSMHQAAMQCFESIAVQNTGFELITYSSLLLFFGYVQQNGCYEKEFESSLRDSKRIEQLKLALELIETSYDTAITLDDLSRAAGLSSKYFCRFFQEMTHSTPFDYLNYFRIERACCKMQNLEASLTDIAFTCGFNDLSYFIRTFKKYKGVTPKKFKMHLFQTTKSIAIPFK